MQIVIHTNKIFVLQSSVLSRKDEDAVQAALGNRDLLRYLCTYLPLKELEHCRLVNRFWHFEVGSYIRDFGQCEGKISSESPCSDLNNLDQLLSQMTLLPIINSLNINLCRSVHSGCTLISDVSEMCDKLLAKLSLKYLVITWDKDFRPKNCPATEFVVNLFRRQLSDLEFLTIAHTHETCYQYFGNDSTPSMPKLKVLDIGRVGGLNKMRKEFFCKIIDGAPNLTKLKGHFGPEIVEVLPESKYCLLDDFGIRIKSEEDKRRCLRLAETGLELSSLFLIAPFKRPYLASIVDALEQMLSSSWKSLKELEIDPEKFPLSSLNFPPLVNLKKLKLDSEFPQSQLLNVLRSIDFPLLLPALSEVGINMWNSSFETSEYRGSNIDLVPFDAPHSSTTVTNLDVLADLEEITFKDLSQIFPQVSIFGAHHGDNLSNPIPYADLWASWSQLESVDLTEGPEALERNFDAEFLGIDPEEVSLLREMTEDYLDSVHIVPIRPCVLTLPRKIESATLFTVDYREVTLI